MSQQVTEKVWNGLVHVRVSYQDAEYLLEAKRMLYFPVYFPRIIDFFRIATGCLDLCAQPVWLEHGNVAIRWNLPVGLLYDLLYLPDHETARDRSWTLVLRLASPHNPYPSDQIIPFGPASGETVDYDTLLNQVFINALKQSCYVLNGNSRSVLSLSADDTCALWRAMAKHDMSVYSNIRRKLATPGQGTRHRLPLKIFEAGSATLFQAPVWSADTDGRPNTLARAMSAQVAGLSARPFPRVYVHGVNVDVLLNEPLVDLWTRFRFMDNFLYIVITRN
ncbi:hypothetical protein METBIDRAFT_44020 [Metschnikowia bicuspidata var. bicuspidata NRRL YB-4993]|uniref:Autophagy protein 5 n=1 Tax=Metschnikowia bicuspidata var. bicuspidata NRRL YB-4993 TaxID=869754 RepID=A0A1A0H8M0_9ASCO|nr:hypothetical protein METBIDRAFT_44020 [Metschnikowia bicuspidata var. bicuspidata NRRL YB-4993]OBA20361.1 hypothetical protein METBIDRAFT_44020 [Metschnikowia bicuspidata var. bicuspidata NRRL YB-4993]